MFEFIVRFVAELLDTIFVSGVHLPQKGRPKRGYWCLMAIAIVVVALVATGIKYLVR